MAAKSKKDKGTKTPKTKKSKSIAAKQPPLKMTLGEWFIALENSAKAAAASGTLKVGACLVTDPHTGTEGCVLADETTCKSLKGTFLGGPCPN